jgi:3-oxoadipate enol-lactonase
VAVARVNGADLWYELEGSGPPLVLLHAGGTDARMWDEQYPRLAEQFSVLRFDARGHGRSSLPAGSSSFVDDLTRLMDAVGLEAATLVGLSTGARVAVETALEHPRRASALVLASPVLRDQPRSAEVRRFAADEDALFERGDIEAAIELGQRFWVAGPHRRLEELDLTLREQLTEMGRQVYANYLAADPRPGPEKEPPGQPLANITAPTLVVVGRLDVEEILATAARLQTEIPTARLVTVADVGHMISLERPNDFTELVMDFLTDIA